MAYRTVDKNQIWGPSVSFVPHELTLIVNAPFNSLSAAFVRLEMLLNV